MLFFLSSVVCAHTGSVHGVVVASTQVSLVVTSRPEQGESVCVDSLVPGGGVVHVQFDANFHTKYWTELVEHNPFK